MSEVEDQTVSKMTDAEFIAECEKTYHTTSFGGVDIKFHGGSGEMFREAIERLKRAQELIASRDERIEYFKTSYRAQWEELLAGAHKEIAELKSLLLWLWDSEGFVAAASVLSQHSFPEKQRIEEILKGPKPPS